MLINDLLASLAQVARIFVAKVEQNLSRGYPSAIKDSIRIGSPVGDRGVAYIEVFVGGKDAPMATAFEWGSGLHATRGPRQDYEITPKKAKKLHFIWYYPSPLGRKWIVPDDEEVFFDFVLHPGIAPRPFLTPALRDETTRAQIRKVLSQGFRAMLLIGTEPVYVVEVKL